MKIVLSQEDLQKAAHILRRHGLAQVSFEIPTKDVDVEEVELKTGPQYVFAEMTYLTKKPFPFNFGQMVSNAGRSSVQSSLLPKSKRRAR
jgi:hypothetical protein